GRCPPTPSTWIAGPLVPRDRPPADEEPISDGPRVPARPACCPLASPCAMGCACTALHTAGSVRPRASRRKPAVRFRGPGRAGPFVPARPAAAPPAPALTLGSSSISWHSSAWRFLSGLHPEISSGPGGTATSNFSNDRDEAAAADSSALGGRLSVEPEKQPTPVSHRIPCPSPSRYFARTR